MKKIAIIGFGGAGYSAAEEIRRLDPRAVMMCIRIRIQAHTC